MYITGFGETDDVSVSQPEDLTYREIDGQYYVTNPNRHSITILDKHAFGVLQACQSRTVSEVIRTEDIELADQESAQYLLTFLKELEQNGLINLEGRKGKPGTVFQKGGIDEDK